MKEEGKKKRSNGSEVGNYLPFLLMEFSNFSEPDSASSTLPLHGWKRCTIISFRPRSMSERVKSDHTPFFLKYQFVSMDEESF